MPTLLIPPAPTLSWQKSERKEIHREFRGNSKPDPPPRNPHNTLPQVLLAGICSSRP